MRSLMAAAMLLTSASAAVPTATQVGSLKEPGIGIALGPAGTLWHTSEHAVGSTTQAGITTETDLGQDAHARTIVAGDDGAVWFVHHVHAIGRTTGLGDLAVFDDLTVEPRAIAEGPGDGIWFIGKDKRSGHKDDVVGRITADGALTVVGEGLKGEATGLAAGPDGQMWFTEPKTRRIGRITTDGTLSEIPVDAEPVDIVAGPDGAMWFTDDKGTVGRVTTDGTVSRFTGAGSDPGDIAVGPDGALWYTLDHGVGRITTAGEIASVDLPGTEPVALTAGPDAAIYFTDAKAKSLGRVDTTTPPAPDATPSPDGTPGPSRHPDHPDHPGHPAPAPKVKEKVVVAKAKGRVRVRKPGQSYQDIGDAEAIPMGSLVDTRHGAVTLSSAIGGGTQTGTFHGGLFEVRQRANGHTDLHLRGRLACGQRKLASTSEKKRKRRKVWGKDSGGSFSTHGRDSVTTVRGTEWLTLDTCRGTLTRVKAGKVVVRDRHTGKRRVVKAGHSTFVRHRR